MKVSFNDFLIAWSDELNGCRFAVGGGIMEIKGFTEHDLGTFYQAGALVKKPFHVNITRIDMALSTW